MQQPALQGFGFAGYLRFPHNLALGIDDADASLAATNTAAALMAILGHSRSVWIQFTGGKSAAAGLGLLLAASWPVGLGVAISIAVVLAISRIVSLSSIVAAGRAIVLMVIFHQPIAFLLVAVVGAVLSSRVTKQIFDGYWQAQNQELGNRSAHERGISSY